MSKNEFVLQIPYGTRDFLPGEAACKREIEDSLAEVFDQWGYDEVVTPTIEYLDTLTIGNGSEVEPHMFKFFDKNNRTLALRHEMTTPIARVAASRLAEVEFPLKLSYITNVYRYEQAQTGRQCEFYQAGVELMGMTAATADAEVIALAIESLRQAGLENFQISLGQVEFINGVMKQFKLSAKQQQEIKHAMVTRNLVELGDMLDKSELGKNAKEILKKIPLLHGKIDMLKSVYHMICNEQSKRALDNLNEIYNLLDSYGVAEYVNFDLGVIRDFNYYTGMVFEAYTPGLGFPLCGGGRYDNMLSDFGTACPATGFALGIERIMLALERQGLSISAKNKDVYIGWGEGKVIEAIKKAKELRGEDKLVEIGLQAQTKKDAESYQHAKNYNQLIYID
ncbi:ATP phosphoribosyltransferase regulatory subunit [Anaerosinus sp.]|uniref:ATP phosphoribosyltransferase regulatory subunit n=1 Tax=Selenobaculum sp. TaxID=3074374 RepID=UPI003AB16B85